MVMLYITALLVLIVVGFLLFVKWGSNWGATAEERRARMPGDSYLEGGPPRRVLLTRAISIQATPETVWPWLTQLGRGAGWYSVDWLDNGRKDSARHIVSWIPAPELGDATAIGYLRHLEPGRSMIWWVKGVRFAGATADLAVDLRLAPEGKRSRLTIRMSAGAAGVMASVALLLFRFIDSIMAIRQLKAIRNRVEFFGARTENPDLPETGARNQYQLYEVIYASGERAGERGKEHAVKWRQSAVEDGAIVPSSSQSVGHRKPRP